MTYTYNSLDNHPDPPQFPLGNQEYLEVWWGLEGVIDKCLEFRHTNIGLFGIRFHHKTKVYGKDHNLLSVTFGTFPKTEHDRIVELSNIWGTFNHLTDNWDDTAQASIFYAQCDHLLISSLISYNQSAYSNIHEAHAGGELTYQISYEINWNNTSVTAMQVLASLLTFQSPNLGIDDPTANSILAGSIAIPFWVMTAILIVIVVQSVIPFIRGIPD